MKLPVIRTKPHIPVIGISGADADDETVTGIVTQIRAAGAKTVYLDHSDPQKAKEDIERIDALVVMGSDYDVPASAYGAKAHPKARVPTEPEDAQDETNRLAYEKTLLLSAMHKKLPLYTICRGMQYLNVLLGGSLHQDIHELPALLGKKGTHFDQDKDGLASYVATQYMAIRPGSLLDDVWNRRPVSYTGREFDDSRAPKLVAENAFHHQAIDRLAEGLTVSARTKEGIIEAIEPDPNGPYKNQFLIGVQAHCEFSTSKLGQRIANALVDAAQLQATLHPCSE